MPLVWCVGSVFGPMLGGALASPATNFPNTFGSVQFFLKYPFALPNIAAAIVFIIGLTAGILFLEVLCLNIGICEP